MCGIAGFLPREPVSDADIGNAYPNGKAMAARADMSYAKAAAHRLPHHDETNRKQPLKCDPDRGEPATTR